MGPIDFNPYPIFVLVVIGLLACAGGAIWLAVLLIEHVRWV
jgi:hypothetical protein